MTPESVTQIPAQSEGGRLRAKHHFALSAYWFATNLLWGAWLMIIMPSQVKLIAPGRPAETQGMLLGWGAIPALLVPLLAGAMSDRCGSRWGRRRPYMVAGVLVNLVGLATVWHGGGIRSLPLYFIGFLVVQTGNNIASGAYSGMIPDLVPEDQRGEASGWMAGMSQIGTIVGAISAGFLMDRRMVGTAYLVVAACLSLFLLITALGTREKPRDCPADPIRLREFLARLWVDPRKYPDFAWVWVTRALVVMGLWTVQQYMQYYLSDRLGDSHPERTAGLVLAVGLICATITGILGGKVSDRIGRKPVVYAANTVAAVAILGFLACQSVAAAFLVAAVFGLGYGAYYSVDWALGCDVLPNKEDAAKDMGVWHVAFVLPQSIALPISGIILGMLGATFTLDPATGERVAHYSAAGYTTVFALAAFYMLLGAVLLRNVKRAR